MSAGSVLSILSPSDARAIAQQVLAHTPQASVLVINFASATTRFARNEILEVGGRDGLSVQMGMNIDGSGAWLITNDNTDANQLAALIAEAQAGQKSDAAAAPPDPKPFTDPPLYFEASIAASAALFQGDLLRRVVESIEPAGLIGTGTLTATAGSFILVNRGVTLGYTRNTYCEFSVNARTPSGKGSGWAWGGGEDFARIDPLAIAKRAIDIAQRSDQPVAIEPGRYTVILEPEALAQLIGLPVFGHDTQDLSLAAADRGETVFSRFEGKKLIGNKLGLQMTDRRVQLYSDPMDALVPYSPFIQSGAVVSGTSWIENGVLRNLASRNAYNPQRGTLRISGPTQTLEDMIAGTSRGIWVHRFSDATLMSPLTLLLTGTTRDGTFLIENGKVTKAVKNLRFSESPFFILNKLDAFGPAVRASAGLACPRIKVHDFEFTSLSDAI